LHHSFYRTEVLKMTADEQLIILNLNCCTLLPGSWNKRFIESLLNKIRTDGTTEELTEAQRVWMYRLLYTYRKQIPETYNKFKHVPECSRIERVK
jgi:hypothetical protein